MRRLLVLCLVVLTPVLAAKAQDLQQNDSASRNVVTYAPSEPAAAPATPQVVAGGSGVGNWEFALGYQYNDLHLTYAPVDNGQAFHTSGYTVSFTRFFDSWFGIEAATGFGFGNTGTTTYPHQNHASLDVKSLFAGAGPHISFRTNSRLEPWGHGLVGVEHLRFTQNGGPLSGNSTVGWLAGGGLDIHVSSRFAIRGEGDYLGTQFFGSSHRNLQVVAGVVMSF
jgi:opacity protein-like surface antigen